MPTNEMTPVEARTKLCPQFAPAAGRSPALVHRYADRCADWVWKKVGNQPQTEGPCVVAHFP